MYFSAFLSLVKFMRRTQAATVIQKYRRMYVEKKRYRQKQAAALAMQTILRAYIARQKYQSVRHTSPNAAKHIALILLSRHIQLDLSELTLLQKNPLSASTCALISLCLSFTVSVCVCSCCGSTRWSSFRSAFVDGWLGAGTNAASSPSSTCSAASAG